MKIVLPKIISDGMVIEKNSKIWGECYDANQITIEFMDIEYIVDVINNKFEIIINANEYGGPFEIKIGNIIIKDVYVGKVFLMSGQSNMELPINRVRIDYENEITKNEYKNIRHFLVEKLYDFEKIKPLDSGKWEALNKDTVDDFFAVSYFFAMKLYEYSNIPIGLIDCAVGGSKIQSWMSESTLKKIDSKSYELVQKAKNPEYINSIQQNDNNRISEWTNELNKNDCGLKNGFANEHFNCENWKKRNLELSWNDDLENFYGSVWFRKTIKIENELKNEKAYIFLGRIIDADEVYINGVLVGRCEYQYPPRIYNIKEGVLKSGENTIAVRVITQYGKGGFVKGKPYYLKVGEKIIDLTGDWNYCIGCKMPELYPATYLFSYPVGLYNAMLSQVMNYSISAVLWYQGESNTEYPYNYSELLKEFVTNFREIHNEFLPFLVVQLPNFEAFEMNENWEVVRQEQAKILELENTALIITRDIGEDIELHPTNKKDVGERLAIGVASLILDMNVENKNVVVNKKIV